MTNPKFRRNCVQHQHLANPTNSLRFNKADLDLTLCVLQIHGKHTIKIHLYLLVTAACATMIATALAMHPSIQSLLSVQLI